MPAIALSAASQARWISDWVRVLFLTLADSLPILISKSESKSTPGCQRSIAISGQWVDHNAIGSKRLILITLNQVWFVPERAILTCDSDTLRKMQIEFAASASLDYSVSTVSKDYVQSIASFQCDFQHISVPAVNVRQSQDERPALGLTVLPVSLHRQR